MVEGDVIKMVEWLLIGQAKDYFVIFSEGFEVIL